MPRISRAIATGYPHHITQRGNYRQVVFTHAEDYGQYLKWLTQYAHKYGFRIWAYCLMPNHVHFVGVPELDDALARTFNAAHMRYTQYCNRKKGSNGHLWQGRFFSCLLDEPHTYAAVRYVELNPVRDGSVAAPEDYPWSSAKSHISGIPDTVLSGHCFLTDTVKDWRKYLSEGHDPEPERAIIKSTHNGHPCGAADFVSRMESLLNRRFSPLPMGRPRGSKSKENGLIAIHENTKQE
ncbi:MAG: transposase [Deltaproteobacteria bacterium]|nr:transposase [Deltaproteobacteria bacterium]